jgi:uncharacterized damage-inducible protein DinB
MDRLSHHFLTMAYNNAWANHRLLGAVALLSPSEFAATRTSFFPSIKATLNHIVTVDWFYVDALERGLSGREVNRDPGAFFTPEEPFDSIETLREAQQAVDRRLIALCKGLTDKKLDVQIGIQRSVGVILETTSRVLAHLFQHQIHHRGQVHAMLAGTAVAPPQLDEFFCVSDEALRARDLEELGLTEAMIWNRDR